MISTWTNTGLERLIEIVNRLQESFLELKAGEGLFELDLPQIAVVGGQSAGKSSVLENFVGREFLPRGSGIVTRRPLVLNLTHQPSGQDYGVFGHAKTKKIFDFGEIRREIEQETERCIDKKKGVSPNPIHLRIYSCHVLNLTLIDLPGLTRVPIGDQPADIEQQIREMILSYIKQDNCLILAVTPANQDLATSDALKLAKEVDPDGMRTIGVLTKLDLMDQGTDARDILANRVLPLRRGYIGVVCRSQGDIEGRLDVRASLEKEIQFFKRHPAYSDLADRCGTGYLQQVLNKTLIDHITDTLPSIRRKLQDKLSDLERQRIRIGLHDPSSGSLSIVDKTKLMIQLLREFSSQFGRCLYGSSQSVSLTRLSTGARLNRIFRELFPLEMNKSPMTEREIIKQVTIAVQNTGIRAGISNDLAFETLAKTRIEKLREPIMTCIQLVSRELTLLIDESVQSILASRPRLAQETASLLGNQLIKQEQKTMQHMSLYVDVQLAYINTLHEDMAEVASKSAQFEIPSSPPTGLSNYAPPASQAQPAKKGWFLFSSSKASSSNQLSSSPSGLGSSPISSLGSMKNLSASSNNLKALAPEPSPSDGSQMDELNLGGAWPSLASRVQNVRQLVDAYQSISRRTLIDLNIKSCNLFLVNGLTNYIDMELQSDLCALRSPMGNSMQMDEPEEDPVTSLMQESSERRNVRETIAREYAAHKRALELLDSVNMIEHERLETETSMYPSDSRDMNQTRQTGHKQTMIHGVSHLMPVADSSYNAGNERSNLGNVNASQINISHHSMDRNSLI